MCIEWRVRNETKLTVTVCGYWSCRLMRGKYTTTQVSRELQIIFELLLGNGSCRCIRKLILAIVLSQCGHCVVGASQST